MPITSVKIFPSIGIARLGNSPEFFVGPEIPGDQGPPAGGYKDNRCRIKRQAARFRLFGYDGNTLVQEITAADADITWTAHLANKKASWHLFTSPPQSPTLRNLSVADRTSLEIDPGERTLIAPNQVAVFDTGSFLGVPVDLGSMRTEADGRLLILGGFGRSGSVPSGAPITHFANNDRWFDDVSDGPVRATVTIGGGAPIEADPAWVICGPPDFAPTVDNIVSLYDLLFQVAADNGLPGAIPPATPSYTADIWPLLERTFEHARVVSAAGGVHLDFDPAGAAGMSAARRAEVFAKLANPAGGGGNMPALSGGVRVTATQYANMQKWTGVEGADWINDWPGAPPPLPGAIDPTRPEELTRAALQPCVGLAMYPGIEASWLLRDQYAFTEAFRLDHTGRAAGDVTKQMAVPWQADFNACSFTWWPAARPSNVYPEGGGPRDDWTRDIVDTAEEMVANWYKLGFITSEGGALVETERRVVCRSLTLVTDRSHFSKDEVEGLLAAGVPAIFADSFYVIAEGFTPAELGITNATPTQAQLEGFAPVVEIRRSDNSPVQGMTARPHALLLQDASLPASLRQRFTFVYQVEFTNTNDFSLEVEIATLRATKAVGGLGTYVASGVMTLFDQPNPYMLDGATHWLSTDVRVFQISAGQSRFGQVMGSNAAAANSFIANVLNDFNAHAPAGHPFDTISTDQQASRLELSRSVAGNRVFNFAVARVRYRGNVLSADNVRVFFRLFTTAATGLDYSETTTYRRSSAGNPIALLGLQGGRIVTIPCYGDPRIDTTAAPLVDQADALNVRTLAPAGADERHGYFGCWLDFNQTEPRFPLDPSPADGPWTSNLLSVQELIRGMHQCLVAEVHFPSDPIGPGATPAANDNLSQRNLAIVESDNPGSAATHTVQHTFEIKASHIAPQTDRISIPEDDNVVDDSGIGTGLASSNEDLFMSRRMFLPPGPDELMIRWNNVPRNSRMSLYMPGVDVDEILRYAGQNYESPRLERVDTHTICCLSGDVTYVPLPFGRRQNIAVLLTLELPQEIRQKQLFSLSVHQLSGRPRRVLGAFQLTIPVSTQPALRAPELRKLSVLRHIALAIPGDDQWRHVFDRYIGQVKDRVEGFGDDPDAVAPSPDGDGVDHVARRCERFQAIYLLLLAAGVAIAGLAPPMGFVAAGAALIAAVVIALIWRARCQLTRCLWLITSIAGLGLGAALAALLMLFGLALAGPVTLVVVALLLGLLAILGLLWRCFRMPRS